MTPLRDDSQAEAIHDFAHRDLLTVCYEEEDARVSRSEPPSMTHVLTLKVRKTQRG